MRALILALTLLLLCAPACAQEVDQVIGGLDLAGLTQFAQEEQSGFDVGEMLGKLARGEAEWDWAGMVEAVKGAALRHVGDAVRILAALVVPAALGALISALRPDSGVASAATLVCALTVAAQLTGVYVRSAEIASGALGAVGALAQRLYPALTALLAACGRIAGAAMFSPLAALLGTLLSEGLRNGALILTGWTAAITIAGHLSDRFKLDSLASLMRRTYTVALGAAMTIFTAVLGMQGALSKGYDGASIQTARFAVGSLLPIVGGEVADSLDALVTSASLVKNALGVTGVLLLAAVCLEPIIRLTLTLLAVKVSSALVEPIGVGPTQKMIDRFGDVISMLLAAVIAGAVLLVVVIGAAVAVYGGMK